MRQPELTNLINYRLGLLRRQINSHPHGGGFESLRAFLVKLQQTIEALLNLMDKLEKVG